MDFTLNEEQEALQGQKVNKDLLALQDLKEILDLWDLLDHLEQV